MAVLLEGVVFDGGVDEIGGDIQFLGLHLRVASSVQKHWNMGLAGVQQCDPSYDSYTNSSSNTSL